MLVFISDLHMTDKSAGMQFVPVEAFRRAFAEITQHAINASAKNLELIFLGDVFDLVRTTGWFEFPLAERPWGTPNGPANDGSVEVHALDLLERLVAANREVFDFFQDPARYVPEWRDLETNGVKMTRAYLPGNHDRICNQYPSLRARVVELLGLQGRDPNQPFPNLYLNPRYRTFARHGHEFDNWNIELSGLPSVDESPDFPWDDYLKIPIGELIACELASKLAPAVCQVLQERGYPDPTAISNQLKSADDVRPAAAIIPWLLDRLHHYEEDADDTILAAAKEGINRVLQDFGRIPFVQHWIRTHDTINPVDPASLLKDILFFGENIPIAVLKRMMPLFQKLSSLRESDNLAGNAVSDFQRLDKRYGTEAPYLFVLYGHTHQPEQVPIETIRSDNQPRVYLNTGTWRPSHRQGITGTGFMTWKGLTYSIIYHPEDDPTSQASKKPLRTHRAVESYPTFETWTGSLEEHPVVAEEASDSAKCQSFAYLYQQNNE